MASRNANPLDKATLGDWAKWLKSNWPMIAVALGALGFNAAKPAQVQPDVQFTTAEFTQLITGLQASCQIEVDKWQKVNHW